MSILAASTSRGAVAQPSQDEEGASFVRDASVTVVALEKSVTESMWKHGTKRFWVLFVFVAVLSVVGISIAACKATGKLGGSSVISPDKEQPDVSEEYRHRFTSIRTTLLQNSDPTVFTNPSSPQSKALNWMVYKDTTVADDNSDGRLLQRYALLVIFYACGGQDWRGFLSPLDEQQDRSECLFRGVTCNEKGRITQLDWFSMRAAGQIPDEIGLLTDLFQLDLSYNSLEGTLPQAVFAKLTNLSKLATSLPLSLAALI